MVAIAGAIRPDSSRTRHHLHLPISPSSEWVLFLTVQENEGSPWAIFNFNRWTWHVFLRSKLGVHRQFSAARVGGGGRVLYYGVEI